MTCTASFVRPLMPVRTQCCSLHTCSQEHVYAQRDVLTFSFLFDSVLACFCVREAHKVQACALIYRTHVHLLSLCMCMSICMYISELMHGHTPFQHCLNPMQGGSTVSGSGMLTVFHNWAGPFSCAGCASMHACHCFDTHSPDIANAAWMCV